MARDFIDDDRNKDVVTAEGDRIGAVSDVNDGRATVDRDTDRDLTDKIKDWLDWNDDDESNELTGDQVDTFGEDEVRLRGL